MHFEHLHVVVGVGLLVVVWNLLSTAISLLGGTMLETDSVKIEKKIISVFFFIEAPRMHFAKYVNDL